MEQTGADWNDWSLGGQGDMETLIQDPYQQDESSLGSSSMDKTEPFYDSTNSIAAAEDDYSNEYGLYDGGYDENYHSPSNMTYSDADSESDESENDKMDTNGQPVIKNGNQVYFYPNGRDGMATCERCGAMGIKHAFYSKSKRFCSLSCSRSFATAQREGKPQLKLSITSKSNHQILSQKKQKSALPKPKPQTNTIPATYQKQNASRSFDWSLYLSTTRAEAAPVSCFKHCPMSDSWENITVGMKVEVQNNDCDLPNTVFWIATVLKIAGYKAQLRYEGFGNDNSFDFWLNLCTQDVHPVGWCATIGKPLVPPSTIQHKYCDWKDFLVKRLTGARTLPNHFYNKVLESLDAHRLRRGLRVEVVDKMCVSAMRVATIDEIIGGRLRLQYEDREDDNDDFWCHCRSALIHEVGWATEVGHKLHAAEDYRKRIQAKQLISTDTFTELFPRLSSPKPVNGLKWTSGMKLEAIDPLNLASICVATVMKVLRAGYLMIGIDGSMAQNGTDWFCYHCASPCIFPVGFSEINNLDLTPPRGYRGQFKWFDYLRQTRSLAAPVKLFQQEIPKHGFKVGMKVEAVDLMEPRLICVGTVTKVVGRLLRIHFDGWESSYDQWIDCESPDIYPVGWCSMVGYHLEGPKTKESAIQPPVVPKKRKGKNQIYRGPRKKRKPRPGMQNFKGMRFMHRQSSSEFDESSRHDSFSDSMSSFPPHIQLPSETVAATLTPLLDETAQDVKPNVKVEQGTTVPSIESNQENSEGVVVPDTKDMPHLSPHRPTVRSGDSANSPMPVLIDAPVHGGLQMGIAMKTQANNNITQSPSKASGQRAPQMSPKGEPFNNNHNIGSNAAAMTTTTTASATGIFNLSNIGSTLAAVTAATSTTASLARAVSAGGSPPLASPPVTLSTVAYPLQTQAVQPGTVYSISKPPPAKTDSTAALLQYGAAQIVQHNIPRVIPGEGEKDNVHLSSKHQIITPELWSVFDVCQFLRINDCGAYCDSFSKKSIDGRKFLTLTKEQIVNLTGMKVGPSLKIYDLIQQLKVRVAAQHKTGGAPS